MAKRYTDNDKWDDPWFCSLSNDYKLLWIYVLDKCDHAGIYKVNPKNTEFALNCKFNWEEVVRVLDGRIEVLSSDKWFIPKFIHFQYGELDSNNRVHRSVLAMLEKEGSFKGRLRVVQDPKDKDIYKDKDKVNSFTPDFEPIWSLYPNKVGRTQALRHFRATVKTGQDLDDINRALENYKHSKRVKEGYIQNGSTWFNSWRDWVNFQEPAGKDSNYSPLMQKYLKPEGKR